MSRSTYIYVVSYKNHVGEGAPLLARTVKYELVGALGHFPAALLDDVEVWRIVDSGQAFNLSDRTRLGSGTEFLTREREAAVRENLKRLDGTTAAAVGLLTGMDRAQLDTLGGFAPEVTP